MNVELLQHVPFEGPGLISTWAEAHDHALHLVDVYRDESFLSLDTMDMLILMGGPMSVTEAAAHPWLSAEKTHIQKVLDAGIPAMGICLGAQLLAEALGADVKVNTEKEIGWHPVEKVAAVEASPVHDEFPPCLDVFHWHGETFDLPEGAQQLARSAACENQAFVYKNRVVALQFHLEMMPTNIHTIIENTAGDLMNPGSWVQDREAMIQTPVPPQNQVVLFNILNHLAGQRSV